MPDLLPIALLAGSVLAGLVLAPLGLPGLWLMVLGTVGYAWMTDFRTVGVVTIAVVVGLAAAGEIAEAWLGFHFARRYGGSSRAGWGALLGRAVARAECSEELPDGKAGSGHQSSSW